jgi:hypothetical protein
MLKTLLLVMITWTAMSFLFCMAWSRLHNRARALVSRTPAEAPGAVTFGPRSDSPPVPEGGVRLSSQ